MPKGGARPGAGRKKGIPNKLTTDVKTAIVEAFDRAGGIDYLVGVANNDPKAFCALLGKIIPTEVKADITLNDLADRLKRGRERAGAT